jgi:CheY-like chemotaxis protein
MARMPVQRKRPPPRAGARAGQTAGDPPALGERAAPPSFPIVGVGASAGGLEGDKIQSTEAGCDGHLVKPVDPAAQRKVLAKAPLMPPSH